MDTPDLSIIIVNYKSRAKTEACLAALESSNLNGIKKEIIIIENNSGDDLDDLPAQYPGLKLIKSQKNLGMGKGNNLGIEASSGQTILILNPDTRPKPDAVAVLYKYLEGHPGAGLVGPKLLNPDGSRQPSGARFPNFWLPVLRRTFLGDYFKKTRDYLMMEAFDDRKTQAVDWLMGSCLMFHRKLEAPSGSKALFFDKRYFMYFEDVDLCRQVWNCGYSVVFLPTAEVIHDHGRGSAKHPWYIAPFRDRLTRAHIVSWLLYFIKWGFNRPAKNN
jgi:GT2 family glycosyltransferase